MKIGLVLILLIFFSVKVYAAQEFSQVLTMSLPEVLEIEKIIVENIEYNRNDFMPNMKIKETTSIDSNSIMLRLSPIKVKLHTNASSPIIITALFKELNHTKGLYNFSSSNLYLLPQSQTINDPYDHVITETFTPYVNIKPDSKLGFYRGTLVFTIGGI